MHVLLLHFIGNLHVVIEATSSGADYRVGSSLQLTCGVAADSNVLPVGGLTYSWSTTCSGECFVSDQTTSSIGRDVLRAADSGTHTCTITDSIGNYGRASTVVVVTGVCVHGCVLYYFMLNHCLKFTICIN